MSARGRRRRRGGLRAEDRGGDRHDRESDEPPGRAMRRSGGIGENRQQAAFYRRGARHAERRRRRPAGSTGACDVQQQRCVGRRLRAQAQHFIVARALTLAREAGRRVPDERIEPIDRARELRDRLGPPIVPLDMCQLVHQRRLPRFDRPRDGRRRHDHDRLQEAGDVRASILQRLADLDGSLQTDSLSDHFRFVRPAFRSRPRSSPDSHAT